MFKLVGGVILGFIATFVTEFFVLTGLFLLLGTDRTFAPGSYDVTALWMIAHLLVVFIAAIAGGKVCAIISQRSAAVKTLAALLLILGIIGSMPSLRAGTPTARTGEVGNFQAIAFAKEPTWFLLLVPLVGVAGILNGGRVKSR
jgi:Ca2+/H+ antiporter